MSHTPGPWEIGDVQWMTSQRTHVGYSYRPITSGNWEVAIVWEDACDKEMAANVRIIAEAPTLLCELKRLLSLWEEAIGYEKDYMFMGDSARAAIAKAEGGE